MRSIIDVKFDTNVTGGFMEFIKSKLNYIIAAICILLFGMLYVSKINAKQYVPLQTEHVLSDAASQQEETEDAAAEPAHELGIKVYITGAVISPGVYELPAGSRIEDVLNAAGGGSGEADLEQVNLAKTLRDEDMIKIPRIGEAVDKTEAGVQNDNEALLNINTADIAKLKTLPGIGDVTAGNIISYREENGGFNSIEEIKMVNRIGDKTFEGIKDFITVE